MHHKIYVMHDVTYMILRNDSLVAAIGTEYDHIKTPKYCMDNYSIESTSDIADIRIAVVFPNALNARRLNFVL